ncbi:hypothetical protein [Neolewinella litorea]|uniref:Uncharacterized protein n=1 Tax=Neolewinella litorea TaxID=2562452 RepID=A0A4S4NMV1_9BACT|nr:hypothetical protein [Neolewinella litorea]THH39711.1 hypothetical protein E4021_08825 [Neolewinella litorea]
MKFLTSPYMMAVATIIYMVVGTVREAYFPPTDATAASTQPIVAAPSPTEAASTFTFDGYASGYSLTAPAREAISSLTTPQNCATVPAEPIAILAGTPPSPQKDSVSYAVQSTPTSPKRHESTGKGLFVEGI